MSIVRALLGRSPVPLAPRQSSQLLAPPGTDRARSLEAMGSVGILDAIVGMLSTAVAGAELYVVRADGERADRHPASALLTSPNRFMGMRDLLEVGQQHLELTGEAWLVVARSPRSSLPLELWPVRPDRMSVVPSPDDFVSGYLYASPDGQKIPLQLQDVVYVRRPDPTDPYRGLSPVASVLTHAQAEEAAARWNLAFFENSAQPGGIIQVERPLSDDEFDSLVRRWNEGHQGAGRAHRVGVLENASWVTTSPTHGDMQWAELSAVADEKIRRAFAFPKPMLGDTESSNRAVAEAAEYVFGKWLVTPRLERWASALTRQLLPLYGTLGEGYRVAFASPVPEDRASDDAHTTAAVASALALKGAGFDVAEVLEVVGLPGMTPPEPPAPPASPPTPRAEPATPPPPAARLPLRAAGGEPDLPAGIGPDLGPVQADWEEALAEVLRGWPEVSAAWTDQLVEVVRAAVAAGDPLQLSGIALPTFAGSQLLERVMSALAGTSAAQVVREGADQGVELGPAAVDRAWTAAVAQATTGMLATIVVGSGVGEALRRWMQGAVADEVAEGVREHLDSLTDAAPRRYLGSALSRAQHDGRVRTMAAGPEAALYADEVLDTNTCGPCRAVNRKWIGNSSDAMRLRTYPTSGYVDCEGRDRCRGQVVAVWRGGSDWRKWKELPPQRRG